VYDSLGRVDISTDTFLGGQTVYGSQTIYDAQGRSVNSVRLKNVDITIDSTTGDATLNSAGNSIDLVRPVQSNAAG
jgi:hypothetical protein